MPIAILEIVALIFDLRLDEAAINDIPETQLVGDSLATEFIVDEGDVAILKAI